MDNPQKTRFLDMDFPSSAPTSCQDSSPQKQAEDGRGIDNPDSSQDIDSSYLSLDASQIDRFKGIRSSFNKLCECGGFYLVQRQFATEEQAKLVHATLLGDQFHTIDPHIVRDGDEFIMSVEQVEILCSPTAKKNNMKIFRAPLRFQPADTPSAPSDVPVDPYFIGLWLGDGAARGTSITSGDRETAVWLQSYVDKLNLTRPAGAKALHLTSYKLSPAGTVLENGYITHVDTYSYRIGSPQSGTGYTWNPVYTGLKDLGLLDNKAAGIPKIYMDADEQTRLAVIAGLIDSDGTHAKAANKYLLLQQGNEHKKIVYDLKDLALSCGIAVNGVYAGEVSGGMRKNGPLVPQFKVWLGKGSEKFQHHLTLERKRMTPDRKYNIQDYRPFEITDDVDGEYRGIEVSGGQFQLVNRLIVHNCHLVSRIGAAHS